MPRQRREDAPRAGRLVRPARGAAGEDACPGRRLAAGRAVRPGDGHRVDVRQPLGRLAEDGEAAQVRQPRSLDLRCRPIEEAHADHAPPRLERDADLEPGVGLPITVCAPPRLGLLGFRLGGAAAAPDREELHPLAVDRDLDLVCLGEPHDAPADEVALQPHLDVVLPADREVAFDPRTAARAERQPVEAAVLSQIGWHTVGDLLHGRRAIADGAGRDGARRIEVAVQQGGRHAQHVADVVEPVAGVVRRQQRRSVDLEGQKVAHGVRVLRAIQAVQRRPAPGVGCGLRRPVELRFEVGDQAVVRRLVGAGPRRRRHGAGAQLAGHLLPGGRVVAHRLDVGGIEREPGDAQAVVVTGDAVAVQRRLMLTRRRDRLRGGPGERRRRARREQQGRANGCQRNRARRPLLLHPGLLHSERAIVAYPPSRCQAETAARVPRGCYGCQWAGPRADAGGCGRALTPGWAC